MSVNNKWWTINNVIQTWFSQTWYNITVEKGGGGFGLLKNDINWAEKGFAKPPENIIEQVGGNSEYR